MTQTHRTASADFLLLFASLSFLGACGERTAQPPAVQEAVQLTPEQKFAATLKKAEMGNAEAQGNLGWMYFHGEGVPKDEAKAAEWLQKAAVQGDAVAQVNLGRAYASGKGVPKDAAKAVEWWQKAAVQGHAEAQVHLGRAYSSGEGVPQDEAKAVEWWQKAAVQGHAGAQVKLGSMYYLGSGASKDVVLAYAWMNVAASAGAADATKFRAMMETRMSVAELAEAQGLSSHWKAGLGLARDGKSASSGSSTSSTSGALSKQGTGTAFVVAKTGQAISNHHVVDACKEVRVAGRDGVAKLMISDIVNDLALLQIPGVINAMAPINSEPTKLRQGEDIVVFGFPLNSLLSSGGNLTPGVVSAMTGLGNNTNQIQITAPIQPGSSGSPVLNKKGEVVGVVSMKLSDSKMAKVTGQVGQAVNFAVSGQTLKTFLDTHNIEYRSGGTFSFGNKSTADLADEARKWTLVVECWK